MPDSIFLTSAECRRIRQLLLQIRTMAQQADRGQLKARIPFEVFMRKIERGAMEVYEEFMTAIGFAIEAEDEHNQIMEGKSNAA